MAQNFDDWRDEDFTDDALFGDFAVIDNPDETLLADEPEENMDDLDRLRARSTRAGTLSDDMEAFESEEESGSASMFALSNFSSGQRIILALLLLLDVLAVGFGILVLTGRF